MYASGDTTEKAAVWGSSGKDGKHFSFALLLDQARQLGSTLNLNFFTICLTHIFVKVKIHLFKTQVRSLFKLPFQKQAQSVK